MQTMPSSRSSVLRGAAHLVLALGLAACSQGATPITDTDPYEQAASHPWKQTQNATITPSKGDNFLSDLQWTSASNGWGPIERDMSNGEQLAGDGKKPMTIGGKTFDKGLGVHANSSITYTLDGQCSSFHAEIGLDDEIKKYSRRRNRGSVIFKVLSDGAVKYASSVVRSTTAVEAVSLDITGAKVLQLEVEDAGDGLAWDHADWAAAKVTCSTSETTPPPPTPPTPPPVVIPPASSVLTPGPIAFPDGFMKSIKDYGAKGDGVTDDTAAIMTALKEGRDIDQDYYGRPKALFFPAGTYLVSDTIEWRGCCVTLQGQGSNSSIIRLKDGAPSFGASGSPKPVIRTVVGSYTGVINAAFDQNIWDLQVNTGSGNAGAVGIDYISNNVGSIRNVVITSQDGAGVRGLEMMRYAPGPLLVKNLLVRGFDAGIQVASADYGPTLENIYLEDQRNVGLLNEGNTLAIRNLSSRNTVPAIKNTVASGSIILLSAALEGGASALSAIENSGYLYARSATSTGYASLIKDVPGAGVTEYVSGTVKSLFSSNPEAKSLNLPIKETPTLQDPDLNNWGLFTARYYGDTDALQPLLDSGKSTIYFPSSTYFSFEQRVVTVPPTVKRIVGFFSNVNGGGIKFVVADNSPEPLIIEQFKNGVTVEQKGSRPVAIKHGSYAYVGQPGAGDVYIEDIVTNAFSINPGQHIWARQYNNETRGLKIKNDGGILWILGLKTELSGIVIDTINGGSTELLGTLIYPVEQLGPTDVAFRSVDSKISLIYSVSDYIQFQGGRGDYPIQVEETRNGVTKQLLQADVKQRMPLFVGY
jgi:NPCBM/NEW2 domain/Pectate lyase superfamily protein